jgi:hypothetical protein
MQEIRDNTSVDPYLDLPNGLMRPYPTVPTHVMELLWNFSPYLGRLKDGTFCSCLSYLTSSLKSIGENMILWFLNIRHSGTLFLCGSSLRLNKCSFSSYRLKAKFVELVRKGKNGITYVMYIAKLKDCPKEVKKTFSMILESIFEMV